MSTANNAALSPFKHRVFTVMWLAALVSNIGTWMHSVGAGWLMTNVTTSPLLVALIQTATTLPVFMFALPAGALADIFDRKKLLIITNIVMMVAAVIFAALVWADQANAVMLLIFTFLLGTGAAFMAPAWQAVIPQMVTKEDLPQAVALGGMSINLSRAIGPALAGVLISVYGLSSPFIANALSFVVIILGLLWWRNDQPNTKSALPPEHLLSAMSAGVRYAANSKPLKATMWHVLGFMFFANAFWGLLPIIAKLQLKGDAAFFGLLMGAVGAGAVLGSFYMPAIKRQLSANQMVLSGTLATSLMTLLFTYLSSQWLAVLASLVFGLGWILVLASVNVSAQQALPNWVRARGLAIFMMVFYGSMSLGATFWGWLAGVTSTNTAMTAAAAGGVMFIVLAYRAELQQGKHLDHSPSNHWPEPIVHDAVEHHSGPVSIQIEYLIRDQDRQKFLTLINTLKPIRQRDGAYHWGVFEDTEQKGRFVEQFFERSWVEHLRHHERVTKSDVTIQEQLFALHQSTEKPKVIHLLSANAAIKGEIHEH